MKIKSKALTTKDKIKEIFLILLSLNDIKLMPFEKETLINIYAKNYELSKTIKDFDNRMTILFSKPVKEELSKALNVKYTVFNNTLSALRNNKLLDGSSIVKSLDLDFDKINNLIIDYETKKED